MKASISNMNGAWLFPNKTFFTKKTDSRPICPMDHSLLILELYPLTLFLAHSLLPSLSQYWPVQYLFDYFHFLCAHDQFLCIWLWKLPHIFWLLVVGLGSPLSEEWPLTPEFGVLALGLSQAREIRPNKVITECFSLCFGWFGNLDALHSALHPWGESGAHRSMTISLILVARHL